MRTLTKWGILLIAISIFIDLENISAKQLSGNSLNMDLNSLNYNELRSRRAIRKPGFFWTLGSSIFQQFNETKSAYQQIRNLINDQFIDERMPARTQARTSTTAAPDATTTQEPYRISRREFNKILMRNLRGLVRLYNLELQDALRQSTQNRADFNKQLRLSIKKELS